MTFNTFLKILGFVLVLAGLIYFIIISFMKSSSLGFLILTFLGIFLLGWAYRDNIP